MTVLVSAFAVFFGLTAAADEEKPFISLEHDSVSFETVLAQPDTATGTEAMITVVGRVDGRPSVTLQSLTDLQATLEPIVLCEGYQRPFFGPCRPVSPSRSPAMTGVPPLDVVAPPYFGERWPGMPDHHFTAPMPVPDRR